MEYPFRRLHSNKTVFGTLAGTQVEPAEPAALQDPSMNKPREIYEVATELHGEVFENY